VSLVSAFSRRPALDAGPRFPGEAGHGETVGPRIKSGATSAFPANFTIGTLVDALRRRAPAFNLPARHAAVVQSLPLGPGSRLLVVEFAGKRLLVGQSRAGLSLLGETAE
jgi:Flagellar biosynthesis protein, FliO